MADYSPEVKRLLRANGCYFHRQGKGDHEIASKIHSDLKLQSRRLDPRDRAEFVFVRGAAAHADGSDDLLPVHHQYPAGDGYDLSIRHDRSLPAMRKIG